MCFHTPLWRVVEGLGVGNQAVVLGAPRLVVCHAAVEVAAIIAMYDVAVHGNEAPVSLGQRLTLQLGVLLRVARRLAVLRGFILLRSGGIVACAADCAAVVLWAPLLRRRRLVPWRGHCATDSWSPRL